MIKTLSRKKTFLYLFIISLLFLFSSCAVIPEKLYHPPPPTRGTYAEKGTASWYGRDFHGRLTANGEVYNMYGNSAAHKTLPFGTMVMVENFDNGRKLTTRINDRGPFIRGRIIDLSYGAAKDIGLVGPGVARVRLTVLKWGDGKYKHGQRAGQTVKTAAKTFPEENNYSVQVGSFQNRDNAFRLKKKLEGSFRDVRIETRKTNRYTLYRVKVGQNLDRKSADRLSERLEKNNFNTFVTAD